MAINPITFNNQAQNPFGQAFGSMSQLLSSLDTERLKQALLGSQVKYADPMAEAQLAHIGAQTGLLGAQTKDIPVQQQLAYMKELPLSYEYMRRQTPEYQWAAVNRALGSPVKNMMQAQNIDKVRQIFGNVTNQALGGSPSYGMGVQGLPPITPDQQVEMGMTGQIPQSGGMPMGAQMMMGGMSQISPEQSSLMDETNRNVYKTVFGREPSSESSQKKQQDLLAALFANQETQKNQQSMPTSWMMSPEGQYVPVVPGQNLPFGSQPAALPNYPNSSAAQSGDSYRSEIFSANPQEMSKPLNPQDSQIYDVVMNSEYKKMLPIQQQRALSIEPNLQIVFQKSLQAAQELQPYFGAYGSFNKMKDKTLERFGKESPQYESLLSYERNVKTLLGDFKTYQNLPSTDKSIEHLEEILLPNFGTMTYGQFMRAYEDIGDTLNQTGKSLRKGVYQKFQETPDFNAQFEGREPKYKNVSTEKMKQGNSNQLFTMPDGKQYTREQLLDMKKQLQANK